MTEREQALVDNSVVGAKWTAASRITGLIRVVLIGAVLGPSFFGNIFQIANQLPWVLFEFAVGAVLAALVIPPLMTHVASGDIAELERLAGSFMTAIVGVFGAIVVVVVAMSPLIADLLADTVDETARDDYRRAALMLLLITTPQLLGYGIAVTGQSVQQAMGRYRLPAAAPIAENAIVIIAVIVYAVWLGTGTELSEVDNRHLLVLGLGSSAGVAAHTAIQLWGVRRLGLRLRPQPAWRDPQIRAVVKLAVPSMGAAVLNGARIMTLLVAANTVAGGVVALQLGINVLNVPVALGAKPVTAAVLPEVSARANAGDLRGFARFYHQGLSLSGLIAVPATIAVLALGWVFGPAVALGELNSDMGRELLVFVVTGIAGAMLAETVTQLALAAAYARRDARTPVVSSAVRAALGVGGAVGAAVVLDGTSVILGIAIVMSVSDSIAATVAHRGATRGLTPPNPTAWPSVARTTSAALVGFGTATVLAAAVVAWTPLGAGIVLSLVAAVTGMVITAALRVRVGGDEIDQLARAFGRVPTVEAVPTS